jgi:hypothetical protein
MVIMAAKVSEHERECRSQYPVIQQVKHVAQVHFLPDDIAPKGVPDIAGCKIQGGVRKKQPPERAQPVRRNTAGQEEAGRQQKCQDLEGRCHPWRQGVDLPRLPTAQLED